MIYKFSEILTIKNGKNQKKIENPFGKYPIYGSGGIIGYGNDYICDKNTIIIGRKGNINKPLYVEEPFWNVDTAFGLVANINILFPKYLYYFCVKYNFEKLNTTVTIPSLTKTNLLDIKINLPDLSEQKKISNILDKILKILEIKKQQFSELDKLVKFQFLKMFGDPVSNIFNFQKCKIKDVALKKLMYGSGSSAIEFNNEIRYIRITDIDFLGNLKSEKVSPSLFEEKYLLNDGDVLFARSGATVGKTFHFKKSYGKCIFAGYLIRLVPNQSKVLPEYLFYFTKTDFYDNFIKSNSKTVAQPNINAQQYESLDILIPPIELQNKFADFVKQVDKSKFELQKSIDETQLLFDSLMDKYFG